MGARLFISYAREEQALATWMKATLAAAGVRAWIDVEDLEPLAEWRLAVGRAIRDADAFALVVSPGSISSEECMNELRDARSEQKPIFLVVPRIAGGLPGALVIPLDQATDPEAALRAVSISGDETR